MGMPGCIHRVICCLGVGALCLGVVGCQHTEIDETGLRAEKKSVEEAAASLGNPLLASKGDLNSVNVNVATSEELEKFDNGSNEELIWTDPDNPDAEIPGMAEAFENRRHGTGWQQNFTQAVRLSRRQELPLVIWFHDSVLSPRSKELGDDYLNTKEFDTWSQNRVVRLRMDAGAPINESTTDSAPYSIQKINSLKRTYGVKEKPSVVVISPNGKVTARLEGYDGILPNFLKELSEGVTLAERVYKHYKDGLRSRGYRDWRSGRNGKTLFAKVLRVDDQKQLVYLKEDGGRVSRTRMSNLCQEDIDYLNDLRRKSEKKRLRAAREQP